MIYTMNGMATQLDLRADAPGTYAGRSSHYSGDGFSDMHFDVQVMPAYGFAGWVSSTRANGPILDDKSYADLAKQSTKVAPFTYRNVEPDLFQKIVTQALPPGPGPNQDTNPGTTKQAEN
jgi:cytochrome o ubiquinol oxidase subunit 2